MTDQKGVLRKLDKMFEKIRDEKHEEHMQKVHRKDSTSCEAHGPHAAFRRSSTSSTSSRKGSLSDPPASRRPSTTTTTTTSTTGKRPSLPGNDVGMATTYGFGFSGAGARRESLAAKTSGWREIHSPPRKDSTASVSSLRRFSVDSLDSRRDSLDLGISHLRRDSLTGGSVLDDGTILEEEEVKFLRMASLTR